MQSSTNDSSGFSIDNRNWIMPVGVYKDNGEAGKQQDKVTGSKLIVGGSSLLRTKQGDINVLGSQVVAEGDNLIDSGRNVNVFSSQNSQSQYDNQKSRGFGSVQISDTERFDGFMKSSKDENSNNIEQVKSVIKSNKGDAVIHAKGDYKQRVADIEAGKDIEVVAKSIEVLADNNSGSQHTDNKDAKFGQFTKVSSVLIDLTNAVEGAVKSDASGKTKALQGVSAAATGYQAVSAIQNGGTLAKVESGIGFKTAKSQQDSSYSEAQDNKFTAGGNIRLVSTEKDIRLQNTKAKAEQTIELDSARDIVLESGKSSQKADGKNSSVGVGAGVGVEVGAQTGAYVYGEAGASKGSNHLDGSTHELTSLEANHLITKSKGNTTLTGAKGIANRVDSKVGGKLKIESVQDQVEQDSKQSSVGGRAQGGLGTAWSASGNFSQDKTNGSYKAVAEQSGFAAGEGGYHVDANEVELKGGAIVSTADKQHNDLTTNKFTYSNLENKMDYDVSSVNINANLSSPAVTPGLPMLENGHDSNTTLATLSEGNIKVGGKKTTTQQLGINSDAAAGHQQLGKLPDLANKLEEKKIIVQATSNIVATTKQISSDIATKAEKQQDEIKQEYQNRLPEQEQQAFNNLSAAEQDAQLAQENPEYAKVKQDKQDWGIGGQKRQTLDVVTGIVTGALGGQGLTQIATNAAAPYVANTISNTVGGNADDPNKAAQLLSHAVLGAVVAYNNGGSAAAGAVSGAGSEAAGDYLLKTLYPGKDISEINEQEKQQLKGLTNSVAAVAGGITGNSAANVAISTVVADNAVEHNALLNWNAKEKDLSDLDKKMGACQAAGNCEGVYKEYLEKNSNKSENLENQCSGGGVACVEYQQIIVASLEDIKEMKNPQAKELALAMNLTDLDFLENNVTATNKVLNYLMQPENIVELIATRKLSGPTTFKNALKTAGVSSMFGVSTEAVMQYIDNGKIKNYNDLVASGLVAGLGGAVISQKPTDHAIPKKTIREDDYLHSNIDAKGRPKAHIDISGNLAAPNVEGTGSIQSHVRGGNTKDSPYISSTDARFMGDKKPYGDTKIIINTKKLAADIQSGKVKGVELVPHKQVVADLENKLKLAKIKRDNNPAKYQEKYEAAKQDLKNARRDGEFLFKGTVPKEYFKIKE